MIQLTLVFVFICLIVAFLYKALSMATLQHYKLAFKVGAVMSVSLLIMFLISIL